LCLRVFALPFDYAQGGAQAGRALIRPTATQSKPVPERLAHKTRLLERNGEF